MKTLKYIYITILATFLIAFTSCEKELEPVIHDALTTDNFFKSEADFNSAVIALYNPFATSWGTTDLGINIWYASLYNVDMKTYVCRSMLTTDELSVNPDWDANLVNFTWGPATYTITGSNPSEPTYPKIRFVARATDVIDKISNATGVDQTIKDKYIAQAKTLRAYLMYILYDFYGPVNVRLDPKTLNDTTIEARPTKEFYCAQIEKDLNDAIAIPSVSFPEHFNEQSKDWGRVSKSVARMLLLKLYMHNKEWDKAEAAALSIKDQNYYALQANYTDVFNNAANKEIIYALPCNGTSPNYWIAPLFPGNFSSAELTLPTGKTTLNSKINGWYGFWMSWSYYGLFDTSDLRRNTLIPRYTNTAGKVVSKTSTPALKGPIPMKFTKLTSTTGEGPGFDMDWVVFRYAEVILSLAEAINEQRGPADAYQYVNMVRKRAGFGDNNWNSTNIPTKEALRDSLLSERGRELYCEGVRRQDLIRHDKFIEYALKRGATGATKRNVLFPIPSSVIVEGRGVIVQNPDYQ